MTTFFKENWKIILIGLGGVALGVFLNTYIRSRENKNLLASLTDELEQLQDKQNLTQQEEQQIKYLEGEIYILKFKCK